MAVTRLPSPIDYYKSHRPGKPLKSAQKQTILNVYYKLRQKHPNMFVEDVVIKTAEFTGVSMSAIYSMKKEFKTSGGNMVTRGKKRPRNVGKRTRLQKYDKLTLSAIRNKIHEFFREGETLTPKKVCLAVNDDPELPDFSATTMRRIICDLGFSYKKQRCNSVLVEREDIVLWRRRYLRQIRERVKRQSSIYYIDETWIDASHTESACSKDGRLIILHAGNEHGFVKGADLFFRAKNGSGDGHEAMDGPRFEKWFTEQVVPNIKPNSVIVIDNAPYSSAKLEQIPTIETKKAQIQAWLSSKGVVWEPSMITKELLFLVNKVKHLYDHYRIDTIAELDGHTVLRLPPYHCELNPVKLIWSQIKGLVAQQNRSCEMVEVERLAREAIAGITSEDWASCVSHVRQEEKNLWEMDDLADLAEEKMAFQGGCGSSDDDDDDDDSLNGIQEME